MPLRIAAAATLFSMALGAGAQAAEPPAMHWYRCNTHAHTGAFPYSDANASEEYVAEWYKKHGYQCLVITDHEHLTPVEELNRTLGADGSFLLIQGQEITQGIHDAPGSDAIRWSHVNAINADRVIYPVGFPSGPVSDTQLGDLFMRTMPTNVPLGQTYVQNVDKVYAAGGIPQINHPSGLMGPHLDDLLQIQKPFLFEVWNAFPSIAPLGGVDDKGVVIPSFESLWDSLLSHGKTAWGVASDDTHDYFNFDDRMAPTPGKAWIVVQAPELTLAAVMQALRRGHFYASTGVALKDYHADAKGIAMTIDPPFAWKSTEKDTVLYRTRFVGQGGKVLAEMTGLSPHYAFKGDEAYVRASIVDSDGRRAWTQPVFRDGRPDAIP